MRNKLIFYTLWGCLSYLMAQTLPDFMRFNGASEEIVLSTRLATGIYNFGVWLVIGLALADEYLGKK